MTDCPLCAARTIRWSVLMPSGEYNNLCCCPPCGLSFHADRRTTVTYDREYVAERYDKYPTTDRMSDLRLRLIEQVLYIDETLPDYRGRFGVRRGPLLDVGYGNGSFIRAALADKWDAYGTDVNPTQYEGVRNLYPHADAFTHVPRWRVVTFFDSLEHFESLEPVQVLAERTDWIVVSAPLPPDSFPGAVQYGMEWKHYRPGEHHWYFHEPRCYERIFWTANARSRVVYVGYPEDAIRGKLPDGSPNIMTVVLRCESRAKEVNYEV